jgi:hypothetical protein
MKHYRPSLVLTLALAAMAAGCLFSACKKGEGAKPATKDDTTAVLSPRDEDSLKYLMYQIMQVSFVDGGRNTNNDLPTYYWYNQVPSLDPGSAAYPTADDLLSHIKSYPQWQGKPVDRYSFLDRTGNISDQIEHGVVDGLSSGLGSKGDFGLQISYTQDVQTGKTHLLVVYADKNSPAGLKGTQRGWEITAVNGNNDVSYDGAKGANVTRVETAIYHSRQVSLTFRKPDNTSVTYNLDAGGYQVNPILFDSIYTRGDKKIGYFVFYTFSSVDDDHGSTFTRQVLDQEFDKLKAAGIDDLIVDLRYNGGGAVTTAEYLDSAIAPASTKGKVMYRYQYNDKLTKNESLLGLVPAVNFPGGGGLQLDHVFFIVSRNTASASELTLNNLKPYMDVKLVGDTTYGKPVGFIDFTISDYDAAGKKQYLADLYAINFATLNADGVGGYFGGISPDAAANDYINIPWGNPLDDNLDKIFNYIATGSFARSHERMSPQENPRIGIPESMPSLRFNGMIDYKLSGRVKAGLKKMPQRSGQP